MKIVLVAPGQHAAILDIESDFWQKTLNDYDQAFYPFDDRVAILCRENENIPNRVIYNDSGKIVDVIAGHFIVVGTSDGELIELTDDKAEEYKTMFYFPEKITVENGTTTVSSQRYEFF